jgi:hypothetical protein
LGDRICRVAVLLVRLIEQKSNRAVAVEHRHVERQRERPVRVARGDQHPADAGSWQEVSQVVGLGRVVEHQQPALPPGQRLTDGLRERGEVALARLSDAERFGQGGIIFKQARRLLGAQPPDEIEIAGVAVGVFERKLGLTDAAHAPHGGERHAAVRKIAVQLIEQLVPPGKVRVAQKRHVPDGR